jgi:hypothetical protein
MGTFEEKGLEALHNATVCKNAGLEFELEQLRFRDSDLSTNGGAMLGFSGLMFASDLVFLSAASESYIAPWPGLDAFGLAALIPLGLGALAATISVNQPSGIRMEKFSKAGEFLWAIEQFHDKRRSWLDWSRWLTLLGALSVVCSIMLSCLFRYGAQAAG